jgi:hypothetical protein
MAISTLSTIDRLLEADLNLQALIKIDERPFHRSLVLRRSFALVGLGRVEEADLYIKDAKASLSRE